MSESDKDVRVYQYKVAPGGVLHTSVVICGEEFHYGQKGVVKSQPGEAGFNLPTKIINRGKTTKTQAEICEFIAKLQNGQFAKGKYHCLEWNCNHFTHEVVKFLVNEGISTDILEAPKKAVKTLLAVSAGISSCLLGAVLLKILSPFNAIIIFVVCLVLLICIGLYYYYWRNSYSPIRRTNKLCAEANKLLIDACKSCMM